MTLIITEIIPPGSKVADRYRLTGDVLDGQMDLAILNVRRTDSGPYCCRVDIDGIFNDKKVIMNLRVVKGRLVARWNCPLDTVQTKEGTVWSDCFLCCITCHLFDIFMWLKCSEIESTLHKKIFFNTFECRPKCIFDGVPVT